MYRRSKSKMHTPFFLTSISVPAFLAVRCSFRWEGSNFENVALLQRPHQASRSKAVFFQCYCYFITHAGFRVIGRRCFQSIDKNPTIPKQH